MVREKKCILAEGVERRAGEIVLSVLRRAFPPFCMQIKKLALCGTHPNVSNECECCCFFPSYWEFYGIISNHLMNMLTDTVLLSGHRCSVSSRDNLTIQKKKLNNLKSRWSNFNKKNPFKSRHHRKSTGAATFNQTLTS